MFDLVTGRAPHIPSRPAVPLVVSTLLQAAIVTAVLVPLLFFTGVMPEPPMMMAFVAAPPPPPPPPPPPAPPAPKKETRVASRPVPTTGTGAPIEPPREIAPEIPDDEGEFGVPGGIEGGIPGGIVGGVLGGLPDVPPPPPPPPAAKDPVRVGGQIKEPALIHRVNPTYPPLAVHAHIEGTVILEAIVDREGRVESVSLLRSANTLLDKAAVEAVRQWRYSPVILNGKPERFMLTVVLSFNLEEKE